MDAECFAGLPTAPGTLADMLIGGGWNVFQYKKRDVLASGRKKIVSGLKTQLKGALASLENKHGRVLSRYVLCVNVNLDHGEKDGLRLAIQDGFGRPDAVAISILGAQELAQLLNDNPHLRAAHFQPQDFRTWEAALDALGKNKFLGRNVVLQGREDVLKRATALIETPIFASWPYGGRMTWARAAWRWRPPVGAWTP